MGTEDMMDLRPKTRNTRVGLALCVCMSGLVPWNPEETDVPGLHEAVHDSRGEAGRTHRGGERDEDVDLLVQWRVYAESSEGLRGALTEADIAQTGLLGNLQDVLDGVRDVMPGKVVDTVVPELGRGGTVVNGLFGVLVAAVVAKPDVETQLSKGEGNGSFRGSEADPALRVHEKPMMEVHDWLAGRYTGMFAGLSAFCG